MPIDTQMGLEPSKANQYTGTSAQRQQKTSSEHPDKKSGYDYGLPSSDLAKLIGNQTQLGHDHVSD